MLARHSANTPATVSPSWYTAPEAAALLGASGDLDRVYGQLRSKSDDGKIFVAFMRAFCREADRLVPVLTSDRRPPGPFTEVSLATVPEDKLLRAISPDLLSKEFLGSIGIAYEVGANKLPTVNASLLRQLRVLFDGLIPAPGADGRIFIVGAGDGILEAAGISKKGITGSVLYLRSDPLARYVLMHFPEINGALRKTFHQLRHENREIQDLSKLEGYARDTAEKLRAWLQFEYRQQGEIKRDTRVIARQADEKLHGARVPGKIRAREGFVNAVGIVDKTGRVNPPATASRFEWIIRRLADRQTDIREKAAFNRIDQAALMKAIYQSDDHLTKAEQKLKGLLVNAANHAMFKAPSEAKRIQQTENFLFGASLHPAARGGMFMRPYVTFRDRLEDQVADLHRAARRSDPDSGLLALRGIYAVARMAGLQHKINLARLDLVNGEKGTPEAKAQLHRIRKDFEDFRVLNLSPLHAYPETFAGFAMALHHAERVLALKKVPEAKHLRMIKDRLDKLDLEDRLIRSGE